MKLCIRFGSKNHFARSNLDSITIRVQILKSNQCRINEFLEVELDDEQNTISGLILEELGHIPIVGEKVHTDNCLLIVDEADERSIKSVQIIKEEVISETTTEEPSPVGSES